MSSIRKIILIGIGCVTGFCVIAFICFFAVATMPDVRRQVFSYVVPSYHLYQTIRLRSDVRHRRFKEAGRKLEAQIDFAKRLSRSSSSMAIGMTESFELVFERARFEEEFEAIEPALKKLVEIEPDLYLAHIWLANSLSFHDPKTALKHTEEALRIVPSDEKAYRLAIDLSIEMDAPALAQKYCQRYLSTHLGGPKPRSYYHLFRGTGLRRIGLEAKNLNGESNLLLNYGLQLDERLPYEFNLTHKQDFNKISIHLGTVPGISVELYDLIFAGIWGEKSFSASDLFISSKAGYILPSDEGSIKILTNSRDDELIEVRMPQKISDVTKVIINLKFSRLPLVSQKACDFISP